MLLALAAMTICQPAHAAHQRQPIKNTVQPGKLAHPTTVSIDELVGLGSLPHQSLKAIDAVRIQDSPPSSSRHEGDVIRTTGWIHLVAHEPDDDDYHVQMTGSATDGNNCLIVEVPAPDAGDVPTTLSPKFAAIRAAMRTKLLHTTDFSPRGNVMQHPVHVTVTGQLFYDASHQSDPSKRGKKQMRAATAWELHPVTNVRYLGHTLP